MENVVMKNRSGSFSRFALPYVGMLGFALALGACSATDATELPEGEEPSAESSGASTDVTDGDVTDGEPRSFDDVLESYSAFAREMHRRNAEGQLSPEQQSSWAETLRLLAEEPARSVDEVAANADSDASSLIDGRAWEAYVQAFDPILDGLGEADEDPTLDALYAEMATSLEHFELATETNERGLKDKIRKLKCKILEKLEACKLAGLSKKLAKKCIKCDIL
jgi:hypothetical protein